jgi:hypothetical protein
MNSRDNAYLYSIHSDRLRAAQPVPSNYERPVPAKYIKEYRRSVLDFPLLALDVCLLARSYSPMSIWPSKISS